MDIKSKIITSILIAALFVVSSIAYAQMYYTASGSEAVANNGKEWISKELPPAVIFFSDNSGLAELKADISSLVDYSASSNTALLAEPENFADFKMNLDQKQIMEELYSGKVFTTAGCLKINGIKSTVPAQYMLEPSGEGENGFTLSLIIRLNPADFNIRIAGEAKDAPLLLKITNGIVNEI